jgi:hypothetical protein
VGLGLEELRRGSRPGGATVWVSAWRSCGVGLGLGLGLRQSRSQHGGMVVIGWKCAWVCRSRLGLANLSHVVVYLLTLILIWLFWMTFDFDFG